ncbi:TBC domain containing protein [Spraguea lophii 42_110]|uniref:TBC domain containing protein n=1 Tax=Spraguea lophii (strain 42_110) TaxID=1358809 RepID=S7XSS7_SPRLO|nr:TBC domain containing protein [Spraguea lophii 42_110]
MFPLSFKPMDYSLEEYFYQKTLTISSILNKKVLCITELKKCAWGGIPKCLRPLCWRIMIEGIGENKVSRMEEFKNRKEKYYNGLKYNLRGDYHLNEDERIKYNLNGCGDIKFLCILEDRINNEIMKCRMENKDLMDIINNFYNIVKEEIEKDCNFNVFKEEIKIGFLNSNKEIKEKEKNNVKVKPIEKKYVENNVKIEPIEKMDIDMKNRLIYRIKKFINIIYKNLIRLDEIFNGEEIQEEDYKLFFLDKKIFHQIFIDIRRIGKEFRVKNNKNLDFIYLEILTAVAQNKPLVGYVQGMADLLVPFIDVFYGQEEIIYCGISSTFYCYSKIIEKIQDNYIGQQQGIYHLVYKLEKLIKVLDPSLYCHLENEGVKTHMFSFRWFNCIFAREFILDDQLMILDTLLSNKDFKDFLLHFAFSLLSNFKEKINEGDFSDIIILLQNIKERKWKHSELLVLFSKAYINQEIFYGTKIELYYK